MKINALRQQDERERRNIKIDWLKNVCIRPLSSEQPCTPTQAVSAAPRGATAHAARLRAPAGLGKPGAVSNKSTIKYNT